ncbi:MAG: M16 family metallopeptidase [Candidatus Sericytochromatia bacterium]
MSNGVRVLVEELPHVQSAALGFWVDVGSVLEETELNGMCHFIEHMLFKGTRNRTALEIAQSLEVTGGSLNAFTDKEHTVFHARVLASEVPLALEVIADMLRHSLFDAGEIRREKAVVIEEIKMYDDTPDDLVHELLSEAVWSGHPLAQPITGTKGSVRRLSREAILGFLDRFYTPDRLVVSVAGNVKAEAILEQLERLLGGMPTRRDGAKEPPAAPRAGQIVKYRDIEQVHYCLGTPGVSVDDPRRYALAILNAILGGGMSSRLFQEVREKRGLVYAISSYEALYRPHGMFAVSASMSPKHLPTVIALVKEELEKAKGGEITEEELSQAKRQLAGSLLLSLEVPRHRMSRMAQNELYYGRKVSPEEVLEAIEAVTLQDLTVLARDLFVPSAYATTAVGPIRRLPAAS